MRSWSYFSNLSAVVASAADSTRYESRSNSPGLDFAYPGGLRWDPLPSQIQDPINTPSTDPNSFATSAGPPCRRRISESFLLPCNAALAV